ncbi:MAG: hypothetical protein Q8P41_10230 [Pseudomonadota bacterium]|nr:hypothetical protein [Pseudomonadota bacterium]
MPIYAYRCACGKTADVLVRGLEPQTCDDVPELSGLCAEPGLLSRTVTAPYVGRGASGGGGGASPSMGESCGHCGNTPGSCES